MPKPPVAEVRPYEVVSSHGTRIDNYYWLRDDTRSDPGMLAYIKAENAYKEAILAPLQLLEETIYREIVGRIKKDDIDVPYRWRGDYYYDRYETGGEYALHCRKSESLDSPEDILLNANELAEGHDYYHIGDFDISPDNRLLAWSEDTNGRRQYTIRFRNLETGELLPDTITGTDPGVEFSDDNRSLFYIENNPVTLLGERVKRHRVGTATTEDELVYEEHDHSYYISIGRSGDDRFFMVTLESTVADEVLYMPAGAADNKLTVLMPREQDHEYSADHIADRWIIYTNWEARNFRIMEAGDDKIHDRANWRDLVSHDNQVFIGDFELFDGFLVVAERRDGLRNLRILNLDDGTVTPVGADDPAYVMFFDVNAEQNTEWLRYSYTSLTTPETIFELNMRTGERRQLKQEEVLGGFDSTNYVTERVWATARDGSRIPVSVLYRNGFKPDGTAPMYQYAYGAYGAASDPEFDDNILSLVDRGFVYAIAHVRGGNEMGRAWYDDGKLLNKVNTFTDFIDVTRALVDKAYAHPDKVIASGASAGGLLMGAINNMAPNDYALIIADVPFVDVVTTMMDETIPLTSNEWDEWGNPQEKVHYDKLLAYSPYDNVKAMDYPTLLVTSGLWDSQVQYYEPTKWVARLRAMKTDDNILLLHTNMDAGHGGKSGRFQARREYAMGYAFILDTLGLAED